MQTTSTLEYEIADAMQSAARAKGQPVSNYATAVYKELRKTQDQAEGITDDEARDLLVISSLENIAPPLANLLKKQKTEGENGGGWQGVVFLLIIMAAALSLSQSSKEKQEDYWRRVSQATFTPTPANPVKRRSIMEFAGVGKGQSGAVEGDVVAYVRSLRDDDE